MGVLVSRLWKDAAGRTSFKFLNLPVELQVEVLCHLDPTSLLACRLTCRSLSKVFESMAVQYAYRLGISAMTDDGSPEGVSLQDRYSAILQFQHTWAGGAFSPRIQDPQEGLRYLTQSNGVFVYAVENSHTLALKLHRPGDARTGLPELTFMCVAWKSLLEPRDLSVASYTVDLSEDLLIITLPRDIEHHHHFLSISSDCYPHPLAASSVLRALRSTQAGHAIRHTKDIDYLEILSDLVAWGNLQATCNGDYWCDVWQVAMEVHVMNWKTGAVIWRYQTRRVSSYHLIDRHHILVTQLDGIHVFAFDPDRGGPEPPAYTKPKAQLLHLCLPKIDPDSDLVKSFLHIPRIRRDDRPLVRLDPSHSVLAVRMAHMRPTGSGKERVYGLVFLVPLTTIHIYLSRWQTGWRRSLILPWDDWGPTGARIVSLMKVNVLSLSLATYGSGCVLTIRTPWITNLVVLDAHPWVQQCGWHGVTRKTLQLHGDAMAVDSSDVQSFVVMGPSRKEKTVVLEGRFPCRMVLYKVLRNAEYRGIHTVLTGEELVVIRTREW